MTTEPQSSRYLGDRVEIIEIGRRSVRSGGDQGDGVGRSGTHLNLLA